MSKSFSKSGSRPRPWTIVFYGSEMELRHILISNRARISHYAYILHDKDLYLTDCKDDSGELIHKAGEVEKAHFHCLVDFFNGHTFTAVKKMFTTATDNPRVEPISDRQTQYEYLWHKNDPEKYQYPKTDIRSDSLDYWEKICVHGDRGKSDNRAEQIVMDMLVGISPRIMLARYGRDYVIHFKQYEEICQQIKHYDFEQSCRQSNLPEQVSAQEIESFNTSEIPFGD